MLSEPRSTNKQRNTRGSFSREETLISEGQGIRVRHRKRTLRLSRPMVLPMSPRGLGSGCVRSGPRGRGTPGRFGGA